MKIILLLLALGTVSVSRSASRSPQEQERRIILEELFQVRKYVAGKFFNMLQCGSSPEDVEKFKNEYLIPLFKGQGAMCGINFDFTDGISSLPIVWKNIKSVVDFNHTLTSNAQYYGNMWVGYYINPINGEQESITKVRSAPYFEPCIEYVIMHESIRQ